MAITSQDFITPVDILTQTLKDLRTKPFWDNYISQAASAVISGAGTTVIASGTYTGMITGGIMAYVGDANLAGLTSFRLKLDGNIVADIALPIITGLCRSKSTLPIFISQWSIDGTTAIFQIQQGLHFLTSWEIAVITGVTANFTLVYLIPVGRND